MSVSECQPVSPEAVRIGKRIRKLRKAMKLSQRKLAQRSDRNPTTIWRYENGTMQPRVPALVVIARVLATTTEYLITGKRPKQQ